MQEDRSGYLAPDQYLSRDEYRSLYLVDSFDQVGGKVENFNLINSTQLLESTAIALQRFKMDYNNLNVNVRNNTWTISTDSFPGVYSVMQLPEGTYTPASFLAAFVAQFNVVAGATVISGTLLNGNRMVITKTGSVQFSVHLPQVTINGVSQDDPRIVQPLGLTTTGSPSLNNYYGSFTFNSMSMNYTRYFDIQSSQLTRFNSTDEISNRKYGNVVMRIAVSTAAGNPLLNIDQEFYHFKWMKVQYRTSLGTLDFRLVDQYGDLLYIPSYSQSSSNYSMTFQTRIN